MFEPRDELDKMFDSDHSRKLASPCRQRAAVRRFDLVAGRKEPQYNESVDLSFETVPCLEKLGRKAQSYTIPVSAREAQFSRQVIDERRGCYR